ncbi:MAG: acyl-CoA synthetase [Acidimicrobiia bacterium]|nr:acyl-CoA synthetase [Acidimicrobiia bacterium]
MAGWNFAEVWEAVARRIPDAPAQAHGGRRVSWREFDRRANGVARTLLERGAQEQDKVAQYLYNGPEYLQSVFAAFKAGLATVNTNYRYVDDELVYLWDNADCVAVVFHATFAERIERIRDRLPRIATWLWVAEDPGASCPEWALPFEDAAFVGTHEPAAGPWGRSGDHQWLLYTGGTTGMPKGVMWRQDDLFRNLVGGLAPELREGEVDAARVEAYVAERAAVPGLVGMPACPLMHGTGQMTQLIVLSGGGSSVTLPARNLDTVELLDTIERDRVQQVAMVGDAFARPVLRALDAEPDRWDLSSLFIIASSGVMFSEESKARLLRHLPGALIVDVFSSSEALGMGRSVSSAGGTETTAHFTTGEDTIVVGDDGTRVQPGSGVIGRVAVGGFQPLGYYKDEAKTASTFLTVDGRRYSVPGDYATVEGDGSLTLLGRGSVCINTGGEKVFPEEVEEAMKTHPSVLDAVAVGVPDEKFGEAVCGVVEVDPGTELATADLVAHVKARLASFKAPRHMVAVDSIGRAANGKVDYTRLRALAADRVGRTR